MNDLRNNFSLYFDFYSVVLYGGFSKAANELYISQSTLSRNVSKLEEQLNRKLIIRLQNGIQLTKSGEEIYKALTDVFYIFNNKDFEYNDKIIIGTTKNIADYFLKDFILNFYKENPNIKFSVRTSDSKSLKQLLFNREIDFMIDYLPFNVDNKDLNVVIKPIGEFKTCFACTKTYFEENKDKLDSLKNIVKQNIFAPGISRRRQILDQFLFQQGLKIDPNIEVHNSELLLNLVRLNNGIGYFIYDEIKDKLDEFVILDDYNKFPTNPIGLMYFNAHKSKNMIKFIEELEKAK